MSLTLLPYLSIALLLGAAGVCLAGRGMRPARALFLAEAASIGALVAALGAAWALASQGATEATLVTFHGVGLAVRLDMLSVTMLLLTGLLGWVVVRFSATYLDGEPAQGRFMGWLLATLAAVVALVSAGNLGQLVAGFIAAGAGLRQLLLFYAERPRARHAARRMQVTSRAGDAALVLAALVLVTTFDTGDIATLNATASGPMAVLAAALLALGGALKAALLPLHGWLTEVMEAPTPVSALLHAGLVNAGGFVLIRLAEVMLTAPGILASLALLGGLTALLGGLAMLAQPAVKTSLAWSTIAQMGFMMLQIGLGLFALAVLHIVAHSLYKAHAFLSSGSAVQQVALVRRPGPVALPSAAAVLRAFGLALTIFVAVGLAFGIVGKPPQAFALGAILIFGVGYLIAQGLADAAPPTLTRRLMLAALATSASYFTLHASADWLLAGTLPPTPAPGPLEWAVMALALVGFGAVALAQALFPLWAGHPAAQGLRVHLANGLYITAILDRPGAVRPSPRS